MSRALLPQILAIAGATAVVLSFVLPLLIGGAGWSEADATELAQVSQEIQRLALKSSSAKTVKEKAQFNEQRLEIEKTVKQMQGRLDGALNRGYWVSLVLQILGAAAAGTGFYLYSTAPTSEEPPKPAKTLSEMDPDYVPPEVVDVTALDYTSAVRQSKTAKRSHPH